MAKKINVKNHLTTRAISTGTPVESSQQPQIPVSNDTRGAGIPKPPLGNQLKHVAQGQKPGQQRGGEAAGVPEYPMTDAFFDLLSLNDPPSAQDYAQAAEWVKQGLVDVHANRFDCQAIFFSGNSLDLTTALLDQGADPNAVFGPNKRTPLHYAALGCDSGVIPKLLECGADINVQDNEGVTPIMEAVKQAEGAEVSAFFQAISEANVTPSVSVDLELGDKKEGWTPLIWAVHNDRAQDVKTLLAHNARVNGPDKRGYTPLYYAIKGNYRDSLAIAQILLDHGAQKRVTGLNDLDLAKMAGDLGHREMERLIRDHRMPATG